MKDTYNSSDFPTVIVLVLRNHKIVSIDRTNPKRALFCFERSNQLEKDLTELQTGKLCVEPFSFWAAERKVKQLLYSGL